jgi:hypothetical protein
MLHQALSSQPLSTHDTTTIGPCTQCRSLMSEIVSLNRMVDALSSRLDVSVCDFMLESHRKTSALRERDANRDTHEADLRLEAVKYQREASGLALRVAALETDVAAGRAREEALRNTVVELEERLMMELESSCGSVRNVASSWTQTDMRFHSLLVREAASLKRSSVSPAASHRPPSLGRDGGSSQGNSPSLQRTASTSASSRHTTPSTSASGLVSTVQPWEHEASPPARSSSPSSPRPTPTHRTMLSIFNPPRRPSLLDGVTWNDVAWPSDLSGDDDVSGVEAHGGVGAAMKATAVQQRSRNSCERSVSLPSTASVMSASLNQCPPFGATPRMERGSVSARCTTPPSTRRPQGRRATVFSGQWSSLAMTHAHHDHQQRDRSPLPESPLQMAAPSRHARTPSFPRVLDHISSIGGSHNIRSSRRQAVPRETQELFKTAMDGLHLLRGLTVRADPNMLRTMTTMHELRDVCCPLKQALATVKQILLAAMPSLAARIRDGELWQVRKCDLQALQLDHCGSLATALRSLMVAHDYLKGQERGQALGSLVEMYVNMHIFVALARAPAVQRHFSS